MTPLLLAQFGYSLVHFAILAVVVAGVVGIVFVAFKQFGIPIPPFVVSIAWIVLCVIIAVFALKLIAGML